MRIFAGSRSALPIPARSVNQKPVGYRFEPMFFRRDAIEAARRNATSASGRSLAFRETLYPLIMAEMEHVYFSTLTRRLHGDCRAAAFRDDHTKLYAIPSRPCRLNCCGDSAWKKCLGSIYWPCAAVRSHPLHRSVRVPT